MLDKITNDQHKVIWIDLCNPTQSEINEVEKAFDLHVPTAISTSFYLRR